MIPPNHREPPPVISRDNIEMCISGLVSCDKYAISERADVSSCHTHFFFFFRAGLQQTWTARQRNWSMPRRPQLLLPQKKKTQGFPTAMRMTVACRFPRPPGTGACCPLVSGCRFWVVEGSTYLVVVSSILWEFIFVLGYLGVNGVSFFFPSILCVMDVC